MPACETTAAFAIDDEFLLYCRDTHTAWLQSTVAIDLEAVR